MNELKELVMALDGLSVDRTGFEVNSAVWKGGQWELTITPYRKEGDGFVSESEAEILTIAERIESKYSISKDKWKIISYSTFGGVHLLKVSKERKAKDEKEDSSEK